MCTIFQIVEDRRKEEEEEETTTMLYVRCHARKLKQLLFGSFISIPPHHQQYVDKYLHDIKSNQ